MQTASIQPTITNDVDGPTIGGLSALDLGLTPTASKPPTGEVAEEQPDPVAFRDTSLIDTTDLSGIRGLINETPGSATASIDDIFTPSSLAQDRGSATNSALTGADPTKTIAGNVLDSNPNDLYAGVGTSGLYKGDTDTGASKDTITSQYFDGMTPEEQKLNDLGITTPTLTRSAAPPATTTALTGDKKMDDEFNIDDLIAQDQNNVQNNGYQSNQELQLPPGAEPDSPQGPPDYGDDFLRNLGDKSQEFTTPDGKVIYYDDGRVETYGNDGRYVMYGADGSVVNYANINDPNAKVQTFAPGANGSASGTYQNGKFTGPSSGGNKSPSVNFPNINLSNPKLLAALGGGALGALSRPGGVKKQGLQSLGATSGKQLTQTGAQGTKGRGSVRYFEKKAEGGAIDGYASGGGLGYLKSKEDGMADRIDATIDNKRPAKLSGGEFVFPADVVSHLGNGNSEAGAQRLYEMMDRVRQARTGDTKQGKQVNPNKLLGR